ncbi:TetR/AcrR family transcriptional regulator [Paenirhodobacter sp.]|uniref:TetR/AcrR family transcriptional regulator n=1 Tax=Paenirhodobacter sp. TaxID=1965326 RepID=UPI003B3DFA23
MDGTPPDRGWRGTPDLWLTAAYHLLIEGGVEAVRIAPLAQKVGLSRTSFYHHFADRDAMLAALLLRWEDNTGRLAARCDAYAETLAEAMLNVIDCWLDPELFDMALEFAVRNWALTAPETDARLRAADATRLAALTAMFCRFGLTPTEADTRARAAYLTQVGYISMRAQETLAERLDRIPTYVEIFCGQRPTASEIARFTARHQ